MIETVLRTERGSGVESDNACTKINEITIENSDSLLNRCVGLKQLLIVHASFQRANDPVKYHCQALQRLEIVAS